MDRLAGRGVVDVFRSDENEDRREEALENGR